MLIWGSLVSAGCATGDVEQRYEVPCGDETPAAMLGCVDAARYQADVEFIAQPRPPGSQHWQAVQDLCAQRFGELGLQVELAEFETGINVVGKLPGGSKAAEQVLVSAHYDHIDGCAGADDNATGVAAVLEAARVLSARRFARTLVLACWDDHEPRDHGALNGSRAYASAARDRGDVIVANLVLEMIGYESLATNSQAMPGGFDILFPDANRQLVDQQYRADFLAFVLDSRAHDVAGLLRHYGDGVGMPTLTLELPPGDLDTPVYKDLRRSDHSSFWDAGYPGVMVTDTASFRNLAYHCQEGPDVTTNLSFDFAARAVRTLIGAVSQSLEPSE